MSVRVEAGVCGSAGADLAPLAVVAEEPVEQTTSWHSVFAYGQTAERLATLEKGYVPFPRRLALSRCRRVASPSVQG